MYPLQGPPFQCRACGYAGYAGISQKISAGGWILFALLALGCVTSLFCWIPLITMKGKRVCCPQCRSLP